MSVYFMCYSKIVIVLVFVHDCDSSHLAQCYYGVFEAIKTRNYLVDRAYTAVY